MDSELQQRTSEQAMNMSALQRQHLSSPVEQQPDPGQELPNQSDQLPDQQDRAIKPGTAAARRTRRKLHAARSIASLNDVIAKQAAALVEQIDHRDLASQKLSGAIHEARSAEHKRMQTEAQLAEQVAVSKKSCYEKHKAISAQREAQSTCKHLRLEIKALKTDCRNLTNSKVLGWLHEPPRRASGPEHESDSDPVSPPAARDPSAEAQQSGVTARVSPVQRAKLDWTRPGRQGPPLT